MNTRLRLMMVLACVLFAAAAVCGAEIAGKEFVLNTWRDMRVGENITLYRNELVNGMAVFSVSAPRDADNAQISLDGGAVWNDMGRLGKDFVLHYRPVNGQVMVQSAHFRTPSRYLSSCVIRNPSASASPAQPVS